MVTGRGREHREHEQATQALQLFTVVISLPFSQLTSTAEELSSDQLLVLSWVAGSVSAGENRLAHGRGGPGRQW